MRTFHTAMAMLSVHVWVRGNRRDSRMRTTSPSGTSYRPQTKDSRNRSSSASAIRHTRRSGRLRYASMRTPPLP